jgi:hypothetical protein
MVDTTPVVTSMDAVPGEELDHVPPGTTLNKVSLVLRHILKSPVIAAGIGLTVMVDVEKQPLAIV